MFNSNKNPTAKADVKDGALVLYLPNALKPCVWRMDLNTLSETSFEIDEKDGIYILNTRDVNGITKAISGFNNPEDAQTALSLTLNALMSSESSSQSVSIALVPLFKILKWGVVVLILLLLGFWFIQRSSPLPMQEALVIEQETPSALDSSGNIELGVPIDVDSLFEQSEE